jgi:hypothetical protein
MEQTRTHKYTFADSKDYNTQDFPYHVRVSDGSGFGENQARFPSQKDAREYLRDLFSRWTAACEWEVVKTETEEVVAFQHASWTNKGE